MILVNEPKYYKFFSESRVHYGFYYKEGLNVLKEPFDPTGTCRSGGFYFTDINNIMQFQGYGPSISEIEIPDDALVYREDEKFKTDKMIIKKFETFDHGVLLRLVKEGLNVQQNMKDILYWAIGSRNIETLEYLKAKYDYSIIHNLSTDLYSYIIRLKLPLLDLIIDHCRHNSLKAFERFVHVSKYSISAAVSIYQIAHPKIQKLMIAYAESEDDKTLLNSIKQYINSI